MCDFILKLNQERRKFKEVDSLDKAQELKEDKVAEVVDSVGLKDKSRLFSNFYEKNTSSDEIEQSEELDSPASRFFTGKTIKVSFNEKESVPDTFVEEVEDLVEQAPVADPESQGSSLDEILEVLKEVIQELTKVSDKMLSEPLKKYVDSLVPVYEGLSTYVGAGVTFDKNNPEVVPVEVKPEVKKITEHDILVSKVTLILSNLTEKQNELVGIKSNLDSHYKNESFSYSTNKEIRDKIRVFGKKFYEVFKGVQKDLNSELKNEYWSLIQFTKDSNDYVGLKEKVKSLYENYNKYVDMINLKLNDIISKSSN